MKRNRFNSSLYRYTLLVFINIFTNTSFALPLATAHDVVRFSPEVRASESIKSAPACQGVIFLEKYLLTSEECVDAVTKKLLITSIEVLASNDQSIGKIGKFTDDSSPLKISLYNQNMILKFYPYLESEQLNTSSNSLESLHQRFTNSSIYYFNDQDNLKSSTIDLSDYKANDRTEGFTTLNTINFPQGAPVYDQYGNVICIISGENYCASFIAPHTNSNRHLLSKRSEDDKSLNCVVNKNFQCINFT